MDIHSAIEKLFSLHQFGIKLDLENTINLLEYVGNPHKNLKVFHIAGSNGKGSTASFLASILVEAGYKVGLYTSPHFVKFNERIRINAEMIDDEYIAKFVTDLGDYIEKNKPTFFELTTVLAFKYFNEKKVDYAAIETGLGGRLDSTNVINPVASVITSISLEHIQLLGDSIKKIASEKAGIVKPNTNVLAGKMPAEAVKVINDKAEELKCNFSTIDDFAIQENERLKVALRIKSFSIYSTPLRGIHQLYNAALAIKTLNVSLKLDDGLILSKGIKNVVKNSGIQCRYEIINEKPMIIFDSAHNLEGVQSFVNEFAKEYLNYKERILIFGALNDKAIGDMLKALNPFFTQILLTQVNMERAATISELETITSANKIKAKTLFDPDKFIEEFRRCSDNSCLIVLGSMYLLGEIKTKLLNKRT